MSRFAYALILIVSLAACNKKPETPTPGSGPKLKDVPVEGFKTLSIVDIEPGKGDAAKKGDYVLVLYRGKFLDGTVFDSNMDDSGKPDIEKDPFAVTIGTGGVIKGWDQGLVGTKEGMVRKLNIPWSLAYGEAGSEPKIPSKADLIFTIKIAKLYKAGSEPFIDTEDIKVGKGPKVTLSNTVTFRYVGKTLSGRIFDEQSKKDLVCRVSKLIPGFKEAVIGMQAGGQRKISCPPGSPNPTGQIPAGQPIEYTVDLISISNN